MKRRLSFNHYSPQDVTANGDGTVVAWSEHIPGDSNLRQIKLYSAKHRFMLQSPTALFEFDVDPTNDKSNSRIRPGICHQQLLYERFDIDSKASSVMVYTIGEETVEPLGHGVVNGTMHFSPQVSQTENR